MPSRNKRSSLADQLASLDNPNPVDLDPENAENYADSGSDDVSESEGEDDGRSHYTAVGKSRLRDTELEKPTKAAYKGQKSSRKAIFDTASGSEVEDDAEDDSVDDQDESGSEGDFAAFDAFDRQDAGESAESSGDDEDGSVSGSDSGSDQSNLIGDDESEEDSEEDSEDERQAAEMREMLAADQKAIVQDVVKTATADAQKGKAVKIQLGIYDSLLDSRIKLQKGLQSTNLRADKCAATSHASIAEAEAATLDFIEALFVLRSESMQGDLSQVRSSRKRKYNDGEPVETLELWHDIRALDDDIASWRDQTLTKWSNKIQAASGIDKTKKFKALNQGILAQIEESKSDRVKLRKRTQIKRFKATTKTTVSTEDVSAEIYDDGDFYQEMLKDLIDSRMLDSSNGNQMKWIATKQPKQKKGQVDTRASKGRKLRYHVHEKIQNFMAPVPTGSWHEEQVDELFGSLFGQTLQVDENAELETSKQADLQKVDAVEIGDDFKLFG